MPAALPLGRDREPHGTRPPLSWADTRACRQRRCMLATVSRLRPVRVSRSSGSSDQLLSGQIADAFGTELVVVDDSSNAADCPDRLLFVRKFPGEWALIADLARRTRLVPHGVYEIAATQLPEPGVLTAIAGHLA